MKSLHLYQNTYKIIQKLPVLFFWLLIWHISYLLVNQEVLLVSPLQVGQILIKKTGTLSFWQTIFFSLLRILKGYLWGVFAGIGMGVLIGKNNFLYGLLYPIISMIKATPVASFILLALVWMKTDAVPSFISFLMVFPIVFTNFLEGLKSMEASLLEVAQVYQWSLLKRIRLIYLPCLSPYVLASCTLSMGLAWKAGIATEVIASPVFSIGNELRNSKIYLETAELFAWTIVIIIMSVLLEKGLVLIIQKIDKPRRRN